MDTDPIAPNPKNIHNPQIDPFNRAVERAAIDLLRSGAKTPVLTAIDLENIKALLVDAVPTVRADDADTAQLRVMVDAAQKKNSLLKRWLLALANKL